MCMCCVCLLCLKQSYTVNTRKLNAGCPCQRPRTHCHTHSKCALSVPVTSNQTACQHTAHLALLLRHNTTQSPLHKKSEHAYRAHTHSACILIVLSSVVGQVCECTRMFVLSDNRHTWHTHSGTHCVLQDGVRACAHKHFLAAQLAIQQVQQHGMAADKLPN